MKKTLALILAIVMTIALVACGGSKTPTSGSGSATGSSDVKVNDITQEIQGKDDVKVDETKTYKKEITMLYGQTFKTMDPQEASNGIQDTLYYLVYNTLTNWNYVTAELDPELATEWSCDETGMVWTFKLRNDITFSNGEKFTADDVVFTIERQMTTGKTDSATCKMIEKAEAPADDTVVITLNKSNMDFPYTLGLNKWSILNREACEKDAENGYQVGTGGWRYANCEMGIQISFEKVESSWMWKDIQTPTEKLTFKINTEPSAREVAVQAGDAQYCHKFNLTNANLFDKDPNVEYKIFAAESIDYLGLSSDGKLADINLRNAIGYAIDVQEIIDMVQDGFGTPCQSFWGPAQYGLYTGYDTPYGQNLELAKEYLSKSGYPNGVDLTITTIAGEYEEVAKVVQFQLGQLGINCTINIVDSPGLAEVIKNGELEILVYNKSCGSWGDQFRTILTYGNGTNRAHYKNDRVMELLDLALAERDDTQRKAYYQEIQEIVHAEMPYVPLYYGTQSALYNKGMSGMIIQPNEKNDFTYAICEE